MENIILHKTMCVQCGRQFTIPLTKDKLARIRKGEECIQNIIPEVEPGIRELFISGICPSCWDEMFGEED